MKISLCEDISYILDCAIIDYSCACYASTHEDNQPIILTDMDAQAWKNDHNAPVNSSVCSIEVYSNIAIGYHQLLVSYIPMRTTRRVLLK